jgi:hypothetical protein
MTLSVLRCFFSPLDRINLTAGRRRRCASGARLLLVLGVASSVCGCFMVDFLERARQLRTYANMQIIAGGLENLRQSGEKVDDIKLAECLKSVADGKDEWGRPFLFHRRLAGKSFSYVLVSLGRDGTLDTGRLDDYFDVPETRIHGQVSKDIVFRDGASVTKAGK